MSHQDCAVLTQPPSYELSRLISRTHMHIDIVSFVEPATAADFELANGAYLKAWIAFKSSSPKETLASLVPCVVKDVEEVIRLAMHNTKGKTAEGKLARLVRVLDSYAAVFDVVSQFNQGMGSLIWGSMRLLLQISMNYMALVRRVSDMLTDLGRSLPRIKLYLKLLSTKRITQAVAEIYSEIMDFLCSSIIFFQKNTIVRRLSAMWSPFEVKFEDVVSKINKLESHLERDAAATAMAHNQMNSTSLARQLDALTRSFSVMLTNIRDMTEMSTNSMLQYVRDDLFRQHEEDSNYHESVLEVYEQTACIQEWESSFREEQRHLSWANASSSTLTHATSDSVQTQIYLRYAAHAHRTAPSIPYCLLIWGEGMTARTAIASLIFQILAKRPDLLMTRNSSFYARKFRAANSGFNGLWEIFLEICRAVDGLMMVVSVGSIGQEESLFVERLAGFLDDWDGPPIQLVLTNPKHLLSVDYEHQNRIIDLDDRYDVPPSLEISDSLHQTVLFYIGYSELSTRLQDFQWGQLWRSFRYNLIRVGKNVIVRRLRAAATSYIGERLGDETKTQEVLSRVCNGAFLEGELSTVHPMAVRTKTLMLEVLRALPVNMPPETRLELETYASALADAEIRTAKQSSRFRVPNTRSEWHIQPYAEPAREAMFAQCEAILDWGCDKSLADFVNERVREALAKRNDEISELSEKLTQALEDTLDLLAVASPPIPEQIIAALGGAIRDSMKAGLSSATRAVISGHLHAVRYRTTRTASFSGPVAESDMGYAGTESCRRPRHSI